MDGPSSSSLGDRIRLNVGGTIFETTLSTLKKVPNTVLSTMVAERWRGQGELFIDRDPTHFSKILNYLRDGDEFSIPQDRDACEELRREAQFYNITGLAELCSPQILNVGDEVQWKRDAVALYWRPFVRYMVDDSLTLPFIYDRNNHTLARCIGCEEYQDPKCSYLFDIKYEDWEPMRHHMLIMRGEITQDRNELEVAKND
nr:Potassium channel domain containing protein [Haemonchus contortus]